MTSNSWCVYLIHGIDNDGGYSPVSTATLQGCVDYTKVNPTKFWVETFGNVICYIKERSAASVKTQSATAQSFTVRVTDNLPDSIFNYPLTIRRPLPSDWQSVAVTQKGKAVSSQITDVSGKKYVMFDAIPDSGDVVISKGGTFAAKPAPSAAPHAGVKLYIRNGSLFVSAPADAGPVLDITVYTLMGDRIGHAALNTASDKTARIGLAGAVAAGVCLVKVFDGTTTWLKQCAAR